MAHYIGKFNTENDIQLAIDNGSLVKPYVAQYGNDGDGFHIDYNGKSEIAPGSDGLPDSKIIDYNTGSISYYITAGSLYWSITCPEWISVTSSQGQGDSDNEAFFSPAGESSRTGDYVTIFYYDSARTVERNRIVTTFTQEGHVVADGYVEPSAKTYEDVQAVDDFTVYGYELYWSAAANTGDEWITFIGGNPGQGINNLTAYMRRNYLTERTGSFTVSFYRDEQMTDLKNTFEVTVTQPGDNLTLPSFDASKYLSTNTVSSASGSTEIYILNNYNSWYMVVSNSADGTSVSGDPSTTAFTINYPQAQNYYGASYRITVDFYDDSAYTNKVYSSRLTLSQEGDKSQPVIYFNNYNDVRPEGGNRLINVGIGEHADHWRLELLSSGMTFFAYPGVTEITGSTDFRTTIMIDANESYDYVEKSVKCYFYDANDQLVTECEDSLSQEPAIPAHVTFINGTEEGKVPYEYTGDIVLNIDPKPDVYYALYDENNTLITTGNTASAITVGNIASPNLSNDPIIYSYHIIYYYDAEMEQMIEEKWYHFNQMQKSNDAEVHAVFTFVTTADDETVLCSSAFYGGTTGYEGLAKLDGEWVYYGGGELTIPSAGTHTLHYIKQDRDAMLFDYELGESDAVSVEGYCIRPEESNNGYWLLDSSVFADDNNLTGMSLDAALGSVNIDSFDGLTGLTSIRINGSQSIIVNGYDGTNNFSTISDNTGTLYVPSGATTNLQNFINALGSNWTVVEFPLTDYTATAVTSTSTVPPTGGTYDINITADTPYVNIFIGGIGGEYYGSFAAAQTKDGLSIHQTLEENTTGARITYTWSFLFATQRLTVYNNLDPSVVKSLNKTVRQNSV